MLTRVLLTLLVLAFGAGLGMAEDAEPKTTVVSLGITDHKVDETELMKRMALPKPRFDSPGVAYGWVAHAKKGDTVEVHLTKDGTSLMHNVREVAEEDTDVLLQAGKTGVPAGGWPKGEYTAKVTVTRGGETVAEQETDPVPFE
ncbi:hypothetical protein AUC68_15065 [Methyloceanibacter methanicus]|uniref:Uncharacterized protein n=1 Tax=Methyloceanibacter methanicus TaxID=1774968 RepID=A0A1E3W454_9HYPH|nr:hypothetical protein [Methyloceanibacter methanicus]ODS00564.1 hypothetical protein AUC68_15065 [Methyloceanibacter methanicus]